MTDPLTTNRARRIGRLAVSMRYRSEREKQALLSGKLDDNPNVIDATRAAQIMMNEMLPALTIAEIALDQNNTAVLRISASMIRKAVEKE